MSLPTFKISHASPWPLCKRHNSLSGGVLHDTVILKISSQASYSNGALLGAAPINPFMPHACSPLHKQFLILRASSSTFPLPEQSYCPPTPPLRAFFPLTTGSLHAFLWTPYSPHLLYHGPLLTELHFVFTSSAVALVHDSLEGRKWITAVFYLILYRCLILSQYSGCIC